MLCRGFQSMQQFGTSPDLMREPLNAIIGALDAHTTMSTQALNSADVQRGLGDILLNHAASAPTGRGDVARRRGHRRRIGS
jgi:type I restriction enzyme R subunit